MLASLRIRNLALVEDLEWTLGPGFTAITGETGSGKSITAYPSRRSVRANSRVSSETFLFRKICSKSGDSTSGTPGNRFTNWLI